MERLKIAVSDPEKNALRERKTIRRTTKVVRYKAVLASDLRIVSETTNCFDFEGSMIPGVEQSFRRFGAKQTPYFIIYKEEGWRNKVQLALERLAKRVGIKE